MKTVFLRWYVAVVTFILVVSFLHVLRETLFSPEKLETRRPGQTRFRDYNGNNVKEDNKLVIQLKEGLIKATRSLVVAKKHVRGTKTGDALRQALEYITETLDVLDIKDEAFTNRGPTKSRNICPEEYKGTLYGYPFFEKGFEMIDCPYGKPMKDILTIFLLYENESNKVRVWDVLNEIYKHTGNINVMLIIPSTFQGFYTRIKNSFTRVSLMYYNIASYLGAALNACIEKVSTEYVLIAYDLTRFDNDTRLHRLIREIEILNVASAGGAARDADGHWSPGCYQSAYRNYSLVYQDGYDESKRECIYCDFVKGSFVITSDILKKIKFDGDMTENGLFEDFYLRLTRSGYESLVCPDSMFHINRTLQNSTENSWSKFGQKWSLTHLKVSSELDVRFTCSFQYVCDLTVGYAIHPCCLQELANLVNFVMNLCEETNNICELQEGTLLGAVKLHKVLPWERDADITILSSNFSSFQRMKYRIEKAGYLFFSDEESLWCCADNRTAGGNFKIKSKHWVSEVYGQHIMDSEKLILKNMKPTKISFDGNWVNVPRNPGLHARNRYGHGIYAHAQHWLSLSKSSGWINYQTDKFTKCKSENSHNCLDRFNADGNLQFREPIP